MAQEEQARARGIYYTVIDGDFRTKVDESHPEAVKREYETRDGAKAHKWERIVPAITGYVEDINIYEGDFGKTLNIKLDADADGNNLILQFNAATNYGEDVMKKLPNVNFKEPVRFAPYAFEDENGRERRGVSMTQQPEGASEPIKLGSYFYDFEAKEAINGYPTPEGDTESYDKEDWKIYYLKVRKFLLAYTLEHVKPNIPTEIAKPQATTVERPDYPDEEIGPGDIPFGDDDY